MNLVFAHPWLLLLILPLLAFLWLRLVMKRPSVRLSSVENMRSSSIRNPLKDRTLVIPLLCYAAGGLLLVLALARPRQGFEEIRRRAEGIDIMIALDLSGSMAAIDIPKNISTRSQLEAALADGTACSRIASAKREIARFIESRPNDRIGLIAFAPEPYAACPPTLDHAWLLAHLDRLDAGIIGDTTNIASPIASAVRRLKDSDARRKIIVLFTDGRNNVADRVTPEQAGKIAGEFEISVYTVGIGSGRALIPYGNTLQPVQGEFDEALLKKIASGTGGKYYHAEDADGMAQAMKEINALEKSFFEQKTYVNWREFAPVLALLGACFLLLGFLLEHTVYLKTP